ncbi:sigma-70 family RNA polymerase sigma factor [Cytobacillus gottheilii]|uniref:sigma-70 family RNA polymerase sigma factor n=1 Tax=Cytobacillus gottheilii TaxID=859144 RepID=UPI0009BACFE1|nr:sigma-70 family RNA polymerase sigma factor [Cytobacillus gottheilii]
MDPDFNKIVELHVNDIRKIVFSYVKNHHTMEDITQEVFISAYHNISQFRGDSSIKNWLLKIAVNKSKDYLKSWHHRKVQMTHWFGKEEQANKDTEETVLAQVRDRELANDIMQLPVKYREVIILYYYQDLDTNEISSLLGLNVNTVKTRLIRSRDLLKRRFDF